MKATKFLQIHEALLTKQPLMQSQEDEIGLYNGLCSINFGRNSNFLSKNKIFKAYFVPNIKTYKEEGYLSECGYWAQDGYEYSSSDNGTTYTELRQNIILLCAAINGEL
jgi:hypothetical protein